MRHIGSLKRAIVVLCIILILAYASIIFLPHSFVCVDANCAICNMIETSQKLLGSVMLSAVMLQLVIIEVLPRFTQKYILSGRDATPVGLKVKLSD